MMGDMMTRILFVLILMPLTLTITGCEKKCEKGKEDKCEEKGMPIPSGFIDILTANKLYALYPSATGAPPPLDVYGVYDSVGTLSDLNFDREYWIVEDDAIGFVKDYNSSATTTFCIKGQVSFTKQMAYSTNGNAYVTKAAGTNSDLGKFPIESGCSNPSLGQESEITTIRNTSAILTSDPYIYLTGDRLGTSNDRGLYKISQQTETVQHIGQLVTNPATDELKMDISATGHLYILNLIDGCILHITPTELSGLGASSIGTELCLSSNIPFLGSNPSFTSINMGLNNSGINPTTSETDLFVSVTHDAGSAVLQYDISETDGTIIDLPSIIYETGSKIIDFQVKD